MTPQSIFRAVSRGRWKKVLGMAAFLVACEPLNPLGTCGDFEIPCSERNYGLRFDDGAESRLQDYTYTVDTASFSLRLDELPSPSSALFRAGGGGCAFALSCESCTGNFTADSIYFSTDIVSANGDTLRAGYNFAILPLPTGFRGSSGSWFAVDSLTGFRDSLFEVRFVGTTYWEQASASATFRITNPALLLP
jgi:hypothetical protein